MRVDLDIFGDETVSRYLTFTGKRARNLKPALQSIAGDWRRAEKRLFTSQGASDGTPWPPLAPSTIESRLRGRRDAGGRIHSPKTGRFQSRKQATRSFKILNDTGALRASLTDRSDLNHIEDVDRDGITFGTRVPYAKFHQMGTRRMPARPPLINIGPDEIRDATKKLRVYIVTGRLR